jgi:hypothetical protein
VTRLGYDEVATNTYEPGYYASGHDAVVIEGADRHARHSFNHHPAVVDWSLDMLAGSGRAARTAGAVHSTCRVHNAPTSCCDTDSRSPASQRECAARH